MGEDFPELGDELPLPEVTHQHLELLEVLGRRFTHEVAAGALFMGLLQALLDDLQAANAQQLDPRYIAQQVDTHNQALYAMRMYMKSGDNPDIKAFAQQSAPIVTMHLQAINAIDRAHRGHLGAQASNVGNPRTR